MFARSPNLPRLSLHGRVPKGKAGGVSGVRDNPHPGSIPSDPGTESARYYLGNQDPEPTRFVLRANQLRTAMWPLGKRTEAARDPDYHLTLSFRNDLSPVRAGERSWECERVRPGPPRNATVSRPIRL